MNCRMKFIRRHARWQGLESLDRIDADQREVILLRRYHELGFAEIGERIGSHRGDTVHRLDHVVPP